MKAWTNNEFNTFREIRSQVYRDVSFNAEFMIIRRIILRPAFSGGLKEMAFHDSTTDDDYVAQLLAKEAKEASKKYSELGVRGLLPTRSLHLSDSASPQNLELR